jgi:cation:H+ antiporter
MSILISTVSIILGLIGMTWSADKFVLGASTTARNLGISPLMIGLTIVAFGTSAPEIFTSAAAALRGSPELAIGNVLGSNIANIGLVLGITALVCPVLIPVSLLKKELPVMLAVTLLVLWLFHDFRLDWKDAVLLLLMLAFLAYRVISHKVSMPGSKMEEEEEVSDYLADMSTNLAMGWMLLGLILMILFSNVLVTGARAIALAIGVSELAIGLTVVAIGTSLPELATSITSSLRGHHDLAVGNIVGSNILNILIVLPVPALLSPVDLSSDIVWRDYGFTLGFSLLFALMIFILKRRQLAIGRISGTILLVSYLAYTAYLFYTQ